MTEGLEAPSPAYEAALDYATVVHAAQVRKGTDTPYITHPVAVAELVVRDGGTEVDAIAALLHDTVEDQGGRRRLDDIERRFGPRVAQIVAGCSEWIEEPDQTSADKPSWCERKRKAIQHIRAETDESIARVSLADKVHNALTIATDLRTYGPVMLNRFNAGPADLLWYYGGLVGAFRQQGSPALYAELVAAVEEIERLIGRAPERRPVVGVDGARAGWVVVALRDDCQAHVEARRDFAGVLALFRAVEISRVSCRS